MAPTAKRVAATNVCFIATIEIIDLSVERSIWRLLSRVMTFEGSRGQEKERR